MWQYELNNVWHVLLFTAGIEVPQYEEEFKQLLVLTLAKLKQVDSLSLQSCLVVVTLRAVSCQPAKLTVMCQYIVTSTVCQYK